MYKTISTTQLKQSPIKIINELQREPEFPILITRHDKPKAVIVDHAEWLKIKSDQRTKVMAAERVTKKTKKPKTILDLARPFMFNGPKVDSAKEIRKMRDEK